MKVFAVYIGGEHKAAHIELHDMRFVLGETIEATYPELRRQWWGIPSSLHVDCWAELTHADGYAITLKTEPALEGPKLYYVNVGGYLPGEFNELHKHMFVVAETPGKAKVRALKTVRHWQAFHKDDIYEAEQCWELGAKLAGYHIHLQKIDDESQPPFTCYYTAIGRLKSE